MKTLRFVYKPAFVEATLVTDENMAEVAAWCNGEILKSPHRSVKEGPNKDSLVQFVKVDVIRPMSIRQTQAFKGDWVVKTASQGFKVFPHKAFQASFDPVADSDREDFSPVAFSEAV